MGARKAEQKNFNECNMQPVDLLYILKKFEFRSEYRYDLLLRPYSNSPAPAVRKDSLISSRFGLAAASEQN